jgi:Sec-independent protein translocase protein TatA
MELFGVGPLELLFIFIIALVVLGPRDMVKAGRSLGRLLRKTILSPTWLKLQREVRNLPYQMMREAGLDEEDLRLKTDIEKAYRRDAPRRSILPTKDQDSNLIQKPADQMDTQQLSIPPEWLGLPATAVSPPNGRTSSTEIPTSLDEWTRAPDTQPSGRELNQEKDSN